GRVWRRVGSSTIEIGMLKLVGIDRHLPPIGKLFQRPNMVEMPMGHDDRCGTGIGTKPLHRSACYQPGRTHYARIDKNPLSITSPRLAKEDDVDYSQASVSKIPADLMCPVIAAGIESTGIVVERELFRHFRSPFSCFRAGETFHRMPRPKPWSAEMFLLISRTSKACGYQNSAESIPLTAFDEPAADQLPV